METKKRSGNRIIGIAAITINFAVILYMAMLGSRAGWETMLPLVAGGFLLAVITLVMGRNVRAWLALGSAGLALLIFFGSM